MDIKEYLSNLSGKTVAVLGIGVSNTPLVELLCKNGVRVIACDKKEHEALGETADKLEKLGAELRLGDNYLKDIGADVIFRTPGMRPDVPELLAAKEKGSTVTSEMQVFFEACPCPIIAVTGSDGKTTTTTVISEFLREAGKKVWLGGNLGHPLLAEADRIAPEDYAVVELSSFQLLDMTRSPHIAVITNLAPNHLDVHRDMDEYIAAKKNIFLHQNTLDTAIFNLDNDITRALSEQAPASVRLFSRRSEVADGAFVRDGAIWLRRGGEEREVLKTAEIRIPGQHNVENYCAAVAAVDGLVPDEVIRKVAREFSGVEHRIELVRERRGVRWYNDSIASSPTRTIAGLRSFPEKVILIAGGYDKHIPFAPLAPEIVEHVKLLILCGATADAIRAAVTGFEGYRGEPEMVECKTLQEAVDLASVRAEKGDVVTLSPACAAFDQFKNFMERGKVFKQMVNALPE
ncbi:MAG: UDP-N-acetylmuramoyl-L-alanine--D-glutamate ligase [Oscillospiraceae bacterium]|nr:UDP-N-acetylmuramoyl-L-alanine--D-glutamate ligase [Oscillospiraceae bacterium]